MIKHIHVKQCDSTQDVLKEQLINSNSETVLVSCENQLAGRGRGSNSWNSLPGTICFSMNVNPHRIQSFTAIELSVIVAKFFEQKNRTLLLKWPNDLWNQNHLKCGGILIQGSQNQLLAGIGLNFYSQDERFGGVYEDPFQLSKKSTCMELAEYILKNRFDDTAFLQKTWLTRCGHLNELVTITEGDEIYEGIFHGIGDFGEALICQDGQKKHIYNGSLRKNSISR
jgi:biotin-[acetyl-CoA-carboxylase] ligase BirA-like protein